MNLLELIDAKISQELVVMLTTESAKRRGEARIELIELHVEKGIIANVMQSESGMYNHSDYTKLFVKTEHNKEYWMGSNGIKDILLNHLKGTK